MVADAARPGRLTAVIATLLVAAAVFFLWGALAERSGESDESSEAAARETGNEEGGSSEAAEEGEHDESAEERVAEGGRSEGGSAEGHSEEEEFRPLGLNLESTPVLAAGAGLSLVLAGLVVKRPRPEVLVAVLVLAGGFTVLEIVEVQHQADVDNAGILTLALIAGVLHAAAVVVAVLALNSGRRPVPGTPAG